MHEVPTVGARLTWRSMLLEVVDVADLAGWRQVVLAVVDHPNRPPISVPLHDLIDAKLVSTPAVEEPVIDLRIPSAT